MDTNRPLKHRATVLERLPQGAVVEFWLEGLDDVSRGSQLLPLIESALEEYRPVAFVLNLIDCRDIFDSDIAALATAFRDRTRGANLPCGLVAQGRSARSLEALLRVSGLSEVFEIEVVGRLDLALEFVRGAVSGRTT